MSDKINRRLMHQLHEKSVALARLIGRDHHLDLSSIEDLASETRDRVAKRARNDPELAAKLLRQTWIQNRYIRTTMNRLALAMLRRQRLVTESGLGLLSEFMNDPPGPVDTALDATEADAVVSKVRSELKSGGKAERVLDLMVAGQPVPSAKRVPSWFKVGLTVLESVTKRVLGKRYGEDTTSDFFEAVQVLRGIHLRRVQVVGLEKLREEVLASAVQFVAKRGELEFTKRLDYLPPETYDFWLGLKAKDAALVLEEIGGFYLSSGGDLGRPRAASAYDEFLEHIFRLKEALFDPA